MSSEEVIEYLYDPTEGLDGDDDVEKSLVKVYIEPSQNLQVRKSDDDGDDHSKKVRNGFECHHCGRTFKRNNGLVLHLRSHRKQTSTVESYVCCECNQQFTTSQSLALHLRCHSPEDGFCCEECGRSFKRANQLMSHLRTHTGADLKPFVCATCERCFSTPSQLENHFQTEHTDNGSEVFRCLDCNEPYTKATELTHHVCQKRTHSWSRSCLVFCRYTFFLLSHKFCNFNKFTTCEMF